MLERLQSRIKEAEGAIERKCNKKGIEKIFGLSDLLAVFTLCTYC